MAERCYPGNLIKIKKHFTKSKRGTAVMDSCSFLIYYLVCFIQKLLQTGCYIKYGKIHLLQSAHHEYPAQ